MIDCGAAWGGGESRLLAGAIQQIDRHFLLLLAAAARTMAAGGELIISGPAVTAHLNGAIAGERVAGRHSINMNNDKNCARQATPTPKTTTTTATTTTAAATTTITTSGPVLVRGSCRPIAHEAQIDNHPFVHYRRRSCPPSAAPTS